MISNMLLICLMLMNFSQAAVVTDLLADYNSVVPPGYPDVTNVTTSLYIENFVRIDEENMLFSVTLDIINKWTDTNLIYSSTTKATLDLSQYMTRVWTPNMQFTKSVRDKDILNERLILNQSGQLTFSRRLILQLKCKFDYSDIPLDKHFCPFSIYPLYYDESMVSITVGNEVDSDGRYKVSSLKDLNNYDINSFEFTEFTISDSKIQVYFSDKTYSGIYFSVKIKRIWNYYLFSVIIPSMLFSLLSYCGFWIDKNGVPGRVYLGSLAILISINAYVLPKVSDTTWIGNFLLGSMAFGCLTMIEYCVLNYCTYTYTTMSKRIEEIVADINKQDLVEDHEIQVLAEVRKLGINKADSRDRKCFVILILV
jgi:hypothetical protein